MNEQEQEQTRQEDNGIYTTPDVYQTQTGQDVYRTSDMNTANHDTGGAFSGEQPQLSQTSYHAEDSAAYQHNPYNGAQNGNYPNGSGQYQYDNYQYGKNPYGNGQYNNQQYGNQQYGNQQYGNQQYGNQQYGNQQYGNQQYGNNPYGNNQYANNQYGNPYASNPYGNNPYSPYAMPPAKNRTGLIIGIIITVAILFLIAVFAVFYHILDVATQKREVDDIINSYDDIIDSEHHDDYDDYEHHEDNDNYVYDDNGDNNDDEDNSDDNNSDNNNDGYDDYFNDYDDDEYYTLHDDIKEGLSYSIEWEYYEYEPEESDVIILIDYPVVVGDDVPNLDRINELLADEVNVFTEYYEEEYSNYMYDEDSYFYASSTGYVTYMSEDVLSVVFDEMVYSDYYDSVYCYSINIDMRDGVILDNTDIIAVDDDFSVDFRYRSEEQNGSNSTVDMMSDQEITALLTASENLIIFYVPQGMEIGFNYDEGWITVTYHDYKDYLKIF